LVIRENLKTNRSLRMDPDRVAAMKSRGACGHAEEGVS
jgi:hypothetical protein